MGIVSHIGKFLGGALVGAAIGALFAPDKGVKTRKKLSEKSDDVKVSLKEKVGELLDEIRGKLGTAKVKTVKAIDKTQSKVSAVKKATRTAKVIPHKASGKARAAA